MVQVVRSAGSDVWEAWKRFTQHDDRDFTEMCQGEYPISPHMINLHSALLGIRTEFLLLGSTPERDPVGARIEIWPTVQSR